jgi:hypothetical protein
MQGQGKVSDLKRLIRATAQAVEDSTAATPTTQLQVAFSFSTAQPVKGLSVQQTRTFLNHLRESLSAFSDELAASFSLDIAEESPVVSEILKGTKDNYEAASKISKAPQAPAKETAIEQGV